jgi:DNA-binding NtrC family response regulator
MQELALLEGTARTEQGRLADAELLLETVHAAAISTEIGCAVDAALALARCLCWQGRWTDGWQRLALVQSEAERSPQTAARLRIVRSRVSIGRGHYADALADTARARDAARSLDDRRLLAGALHASAFAQLAAGDAVQADSAARLALDVACEAHDAMLTLRIRLLRAEIARRQGNRAPAALLVRRLGSAHTTLLPLTIRARIDLLRDLLAASNDADAAERRAEIAGLPGLRLFAPVRLPSPAAHTAAADDIVDLLRCCQVAEEDAAVLAAVCARLRARLAAHAVAFFALEAGDVVPLASEGARMDIATARRVAAANQIVMPHHGGERVEAGVPVRYANQVIGVLAATWTPAAVWHAGDVSVLLSTGAAAAGPALSGLVARRAASRHGRLSEILGVSGSVADVRAAIDRAASAPFPVLVHGESGSGKELVARLLHKLGARRDRPFSALNCAALPDDLVESELFGHARGAFTGALGERRGVFEDAHTGTLFLDEIGELSPRAQAKLLRVVQEGEIRRVGENVCRRVDVRLVTATNRDLHAEAAAGRFRADLLYRLDVIRIALPPLRERPEDIAVLAEHFWRAATDRIGSRATLSAATVALLARYEWPGNIRELQNVLASLAVRCPKRGVVPSSALPPHLADRSVPSSFRLEPARRTFDRAFVRAALARCGGQRSRAAEELGVSRQGLAKLMTRLGIEEHE